jgi:hypothetical protein
MPPTSFLRAPRTILVLRAPLLLAWLAMVLIGPLPATAQTRSRANEGPENARRIYNDAHREAQSAQSAADRAEQRARRAAEALRAAQARIGCRATRLARRAAAPVRRAQW